jgi:high frequency lysogenization protein
MKHSLNDRVLTLAGVFQAASLVKRCASQGQNIDKDVETCINSLFNTNPDSVEDIYAGGIHLRLGLNTLIEQIGNNANLRDAEISRYVISLLYLQKKLSRSKTLLATLADGINKAQEQARFFTPAHENVIAALADLYQQTISTLSPRIIVNGDPLVLQDPQNAQLIRTLLLAGIRSAMAWKQCGGTRWQLLFKRQALLDEARNTLDKLPTIDARV